MTILALPTICALAAAACGGHATSTSPSTGAAASTTAATSPDAAAAAKGGRVPSGDWRQFGDNPQATGVGPSNTGITAANVGRLSLRTIGIDGVADSAPVELHAVRAGRGRHDLVAVTTSYGKTIAFDAGTGRRLWEFDPAGVDSTPGNSQVTTASPVADPDRGYIYSASPNGVIHKLSVATGRQVWSRSITFDPRHEKIASALTISGPWVVAVTGGYYGDAPPYDGHVVLINRGTGRVAHVWNTTCSNRHTIIPASSCSVTASRGDNAIWGRAGAVLEPGSDRILVATGNGPFDGRTDWGDSVLELSADASRLLQSWTPPNQAQLSATDTDLGSSSPAQLPVFHGRRLVVQGGKDGKLHLLDLARLNGSTGGAGPRTGGELDEVSAPGGGEVDPQPAVWSTGGRDYVFAATTAGTAAYELVDGAHPRLTVVWQNGTAGTSPAIAGGLLYVYDPGGSIDIRRPLTGALLRTLPAGSGHWNSPIVVGGRIIEPTGTYHSSAGSSTIDIYHLPGR
ncbi:MAG TPA: PQQ-binding-like beta-propeller repeat protein [Solirubrobacteraceae bacterium]|jgi:outer membrane protein assembly factor BamB|nr:PQQ-binding-like beta-propeller repeat protein [Solirubrobacteraceae bacterium]